MSPDPHLGSGLERANSHPLSHTTILSLSEWNIWHYIWKMLKGEMGARKGKAARSPGQFWSLSPQLVVSQACRAVCPARHHDPRDMCGGLAQGPNASDFLTSDCSDPNHTKLWIGFSCLLVVKSHFQLVAKKIYDRAFNYLHLMETYFSVQQAWKFKVCSVRSNQW